MPRPIDLSENNTPIAAAYDGNAGKGNCACGGKGCKTKHAESKAEKTQSNPPSEESTSNGR